MKQFLVCAVACMTVQGVSAQDIRQQDVKRVLYTLAADNMEGRRSFTPGIDRAAEVISKEFQAAGLQPLPGAQSFRQPFRLYTLMPEATQLTVNGKSVNWPMVLPGSAKEIALKNDTGTQSVTIRDEGALMQLMRGGSRMTKNVVAWVHPSLAPIFGQIMSHRSYRSSAEEVEAKAATPRKSLLLVLQEDTTVTVNDWEIKATQQLRSFDLANVAGMLKGSSKPEEYVIFSAHYDHLGVQPAVAADSIANGADDDASGVTAVIELAKYFRKQSPARSIIFVAFTAEEIGGYGSQYFSKQLKPEQIVAMFNIEMIGKESKFGKNSAFITGFDKSDFGQILQRNLEGSAFKFHPDPYPEQQLFYRSDNATLALLGVPAHTISTTQIDKDKYYHTVDDEVETLDVVNITDIIKAIARSAGSIINATDTPTRINKP